MRQYTFNRTDSGIIGKAFEMAIKDALNRKNADKVSPCGTTDFRFSRKNYEVKQNGGVLQYSPNARMIKGSNRIIYATHVAYSTIAETAETITISINLADTDMFVFDRAEFIEFLESINCIKMNQSRGTANIQTVYNYTKGAYHGRKGRAIEDWGAEHDLGDNVIGYILEGIE